MTPVPGKTLIKVCSILLLIAAAANIFLGISSFALLSYVPASVKTVVTLALVAGIGYGVAALVAGVLGIMNCGKPTKAQLIIILGIVLIVLIALNIILTVVSGSATNWISSILSFTVPVLYTVGGFMNKKAAE